MAQARQTIIVSVAGTYNSTCVLLGAGRVSDGELVPRSHGADAPANCSFQYYEMFLDAASHSQAIPVQLAPDWRLPERGVVDELFADPRHKTAGVDWSSSLS